MYEPINQVHPHIESAITTNLGVTAITCENKLSEQEEK